MKFFYLIFFLCYVPGVNAQLKFENSSLQDIYIKAKKENKLIFLQLQSSQCEQCNEVADKAFEKYFPDSIKNKFVFVKLTPSHPERTEIDDQFKTKNMAATLFLDSEGGLVHRYNGTTSRAESYFDHCAIALQKATTSGNITELDKLYRAGNREIDFLEKYIAEKNKLKQPVDNLLDEYVLLIPADSVRSLRTLQFIAINVPLINSRADTVLRHDRNLFNRMLNRLPVTQRVSIQHGMAVKSSRKAIETKDLAYQAQAANFAGSINPVVAQKVYDQFMLNYYKGIKDTAMYISNTISFYDKYFMTVSLEQILKSDSARKRAMFGKASIDTIDIDGIKNYRKQITFTSQTNFYANELNKAAWSLYKMSDAPAVLSKALEWTKKALEFQNSPGIIDTYARLLYKTGNKREAIKQEITAITMEKKQGFTAVESERVLKRMKENAAIIDDN